MTELKFPLCLASLQITGPDIGPSEDRLLSVLEQSPDTIPLVRAVGIKNLKHQVRNLELHAPLSRASDPVGWSFVVRDGDCRCVVDLVLVKGVVWMAEPQKLKVPFPDLEEYDDSAEISPEHEDFGMDMDELRHFTEALWGPPVRINAKSDTEPTGDDQSLGRLNTP